MRILVIAAIVAAISPAYAEVFPNKEAGVSIDIPSDWKKAGNAGAIAISDPKEEAAMTIVITDVTDLKKQDDAAGKQLTASVKDFKWGASTAVSIHGMTAVWRKASGSLNGKAVELAVVVLATPAKKGLTAIAVIEAAKSSTHQKTVEGILKSIQPLK